MRAILVKHINDFIVFCDKYDIILVHYHLGKITKKPIFVYFILQYLEKRSITKRPISFFLINAATGQKRSTYTILIFMGCCRKKCTLK